MKKALGPLPQALLMGAQCLSYGAFAFFDFFFFNFFFFALFAFLAASESLRALLGVAAGSG
jgi:hypothetical protein